MKTELPFGWILHIKAGKIWIDDKNRGGDEVRPKHITYCQACEHEFSETETRYIYQGKKMCADCYHIAINAGAWI